MNKTDINQHVRLSGVIFSVILAVMGTVYLIPDLGGPEKRLQEINRHKAESLAYQLLQIHSDSKTQLVAKSRGPASEASVGGGLSEWKSDGEMGASDPWGAPYRYHLEFDATKTLKAIEVWSQNDRSRVRILVPGAG